MTRCNCDASCGENRSHNFGDIECRYRGLPEEDWPGWAKREHNKTKDEICPYRPDASAQILKAIRAKTNKSIFSIIEEAREMAKYDHGGGCPCGLYRECDPECSSYKPKDEVKKTMKSPGVSITEKHESPITRPYSDHVNRPWGLWQVLDEGKGYKVKRLEILPDQSISLQYHNHRAEMWQIVQGEGRVIVDGNIFKVVKGDSFVVPKQALHKITNTHLNETLIAIEIQLGDICDESDIVRC